MQWPLHAALPFCPPRRCICAGMRGEERVGAPSSSLTASASRYTTEVGHELAAPVAVASVEEKHKAKAVRPTPGHFMMTGPAHSA